MKSTILFTCIILSLTVRGQEVYDFQDKRINLNLDDMWSVCDSLDNIGSESISDAELLIITIHFWKKIMEDHPNLKDSLHTAGGFLKIKDELFIHCDAFREMAMKTYRIPELIYNFQRGLDKGYLYLPYDTDTATQTEIIRLMKILREDRTTFFIDISNLAKNQDIVKLSYFFYEPQTYSRKQDVKSDENKIMEIEYHFKNEKLTSFTLNTNTSLYMALQKIKSMPVPPPPPPKIK